MKARSKFKSVIMAVIAIFVLTACAGMPITQKGKFIYAVEEYTALLSSYNAQFKMQTPEIKAKWKTDFDPVFLQVNQALNAWGAVLGTADAKTNQALYTAAFSQLKNLLLITGIIEIKQ